MIARLPNGTKVKTVKTEPEATDWTKEALAGCRQWEITGEIIAYSDSHGLCYEVLHYRDGTSGWYNPEELISIVAYSGRLSRGFRDVFLRRYGRISDR